MRNVSQKPVVTKGTAEKLREPPVPLQVPAIPKALPAALRGRNSQVILMLGWAILLNGLNLFFATRHIKQ